MVAMSLFIPWKVSQGYNSWVMEMSSKAISFFMNHEYSTVHGKLMVFFMGHEFKNPMKNRFSIHGFFIIIKKPWKKHGWLHFISWHFHGFFVCYSFFMGHEALNVKGIFMLFSWDSHAIFMVFFCEKPMKISH